MHVDSSYTTSLLFQTNSVSIFGSSWIAEIDGDDRCRADTDESCVDIPDPEGCRSEQERIQAQDMCDSLLADDSPFRVWNGWLSKM